MPLPGEGGPQRQRAAAPGTVHPRTQRCVPQAAPPIPTPAPTWLLFSTGTDPPTRATTTALARSWICPGKFIGREKRIRMHHSSQAINTHLYPSLQPSRPAMSAARKIISSLLLQHKHLNSTSIYLWSPHDTSRSAREQETYRRRKIKMCVCTGETRGLPRERARSWVCGARLYAYVAI